MTSPKTRHKNAKNNLRKPPYVLPALLAVGSACTLAAGSASGLELGEIQVNSALGQPLRASIAYALNPTEQLHDFCIYLRPGPMSAGMPTVTRAGISVRDGMIIFTGRIPVKEPMLSMQVAVDCPYTPHLLREYTLLIDPARPVETEYQAAPVAQPLPETAQSRPAAARRETAPPPAVAAAPTTPVEVRSRYQVQPGDTVSTIVSRIDDRTLGMWPSVNAIFAANPHAFVDGDINRLMAGSVLDIPDLGGASTVAAPAAVTPVEMPPPATAESSTTSSAYGGFQATAPEAVDMTPAATPANLPETSIMPTPAVPPVQAPEPVADAGADPASELRPGDVIVGNGSPVVTPIGAATGDADEPAAQTTMQIDVLPADITETTSTSSGRSWLIWLGGSGVALILGLLLFGRSIRNRFGSSPIGEAAIPPRRSTDDPTQNVEVLEEVDFDFEDTINSRAISLDADLVDGSGLQGETDLDVAEDFGFSATGTGESAAYMEIPEEASAELKETSTDIIPPNQRVEEAAIVAKEISMPDDQSGMYDLSMIVDATKQPIGDYDATAKDLQAVPVETEATDDHDYTVENAVDYHILEQDYEEELTATQALNAEIARAAIELAGRMDGDDDADNTSEMPTVEEEMLPVAEQLDDDVPTVETVAEVTAEITAEMPRSGDATVEMPSDDLEAVQVPPVTDPANTAELTANLPAGLDAENDAIVEGQDITIEMDVAGDTIETKKSKAS